METHFRSSRIFNLYLNSQAVSSDNQVAATKVEVIIFLFFQLLDQSQVISDSIEIPPLNI